MPASGGLATDLGSFIGTAGPVAVDPSGANVYFTTASPAALYTKAPATMTGAPTQLAILNAPVAIAVDSTNVYVASAAGTITVYSITEHALARMISAPGIVSLVVDTARNLLFYATSAGGIFQASVASPSAATQLATLPNTPLPHAIAQDSTYLYVTANDSVYEVSKTGTVQVLASAQANPQGIAVGGAFVYFTTDDGPRRVNP